MYLQGSHEGCRDPQMMTTKLSCSETKKEISSQMRVNRNQQKGEQSFPSCTTQRPENTAVQLKPAVSSLQDRRFHMITAFRDFWPSTKKIKSRSTFFNNEAPTKRGDWNERARLSDASRWRQEVRVDSWVADCLFPVSHCESLLFFVTLTVCSQ